MIQVADVVSSRTAVWEDRGQECHVSQLPPRLIKPIRPAITGETEGAGSKDPGGGMALSPEGALVRLFARTC